MANELVIKTQADVMELANSFIKSNNIITSQNYNVENAMVSLFTNVLSVKDKNNELVGFAVLCPSIAKALKKSNGKLFPFGIFRLLKALRSKNDVLEMFFIAVKPEYQSQGVPAIIIDHIVKMLIENGVKYCETGPELELNAEVQSMWKHFDVRNHKRRRCFVKKI